MISVAVYCTCLYLYLFLTSSNLIYGMAFPVGNEIISRCLSKLTYICITEEKKRKKEKS